MVLHVVPLIPSGFGYTIEYHEVTETTITFEWDPPQGSGPEGIVDGYTISISSDPMSQPLQITNISSPWNVTLTHNTPYSIGIVALNCGGESTTLFHPTIEYGEENKTFILHLFSFFCYS